MSDIPQEPYNRTLSRLRNLYPRSTLKYIRYILHQFFQFQFKLSIYIIIYINQYPCYFNYWDDMVIVTV